MKSPFSSGEKGKRKLWNCLIHGLSHQNNIFFFFNGLCHTKLDWELSSLFNYARQRNIKCQCNFRPPNGLHAFYISNQQRQINGVGSKNKFFLFNSLSFRVFLHGAFSTGNRNGFLGRIIFHCSMLSFSSFHFPVII